MVKFCQDFSHSQINKSSKRTHGNPITVCLLPSIQSTMNDSSLACLIGDPIKGCGEQTTEKWSRFVKGKDGFLYGIPNQARLVANGFIYGIPYKARRVAKFNPKDKSVQLIGPDLNGSWCGGVLAKNGCIYCLPADHRQRNVLKINTNDGSVDISLSVDGFWAPGAMDSDGCIYHMPRYHLSSVLRLDPSNDTFSEVAFPSMDGRFVGSILGSDDCIYGLPADCYTTVTRFVPFELLNIYWDHRDDYDGDYAFHRNGVLGSDGNIYGLNRHNKILQLDTSSLCVCIIQTNCLMSKFERNDFGEPIIGVDKCIYWPPCEGFHVMKFDPATQEPSIVEIGWLNSSEYFLDQALWEGGALADDGVIYCAPYLSNQILSIDPLRELSATMKRKVRRHPKQLGFLFADDNKSGESLFDSAVRKFGNDTSLRLLDECLLCDEIVDTERSNGYPLFVTAALMEHTVPLPVVYHLVRRNVNELVTCFRGSSGLASRNSIVGKKKRKCEETY